MQAQKQNLFEAQIPPKWIRPPVFAYYIAATDKARNEGFWRSAEEPYTLTVTQRPEQIVSSAMQVKTKKSKTLLWVGIGAAVIGGGIIALLVGGGKEEETPSTGYISVEIPVEQ